MSKCDAKTTCSGWGTCKEDGTCECNNGHGGSNCRTWICAQGIDFTPCGPHGTCDETTPHTYPEGSFKGTCKCKDGWSGYNCDEPPCPRGPGVRKDLDILCSNRGKCYNKKCICDSPYTGDSCQNKECPKSTDGRICGDGVCIYNKEGHGYCNCNKGFWGQTCEEKTEDINNPYWVSTDKIIWDTCYRKCNELKEGKNCTDEETKIQSTYPNKVMCCKSSDDKDSCTNTIPRCVNDGEKGVAPKWEAGYGILCEPDGTAGYSCGGHSNTYTCFPN